MRQRLLRAFAAVTVNKDLLPIIATCRYRWLGFSEGYMRRRTVNNNASRRRTLLKNRRRRVLNRHKSFFTFLQAQE